MKKADPSWATLPLSAIDLEEIVADFAEKWDMPDMKCWAWPHRIVLQAGQKKRTAEDWDIELRILIWVLASVMLPVGWFVESWGVFPRYGGFPVGLGVASGLGYLCWVRLHSNYNSRVVKQLKDRVRQRAVSFEDLLFELVVSLWATINRPLFSGVKNYFLPWKNLDNSFPESVIEPVREALVTLYRADLETEADIQDGWYRRNLIDQCINSAAINAEEKRDLWFRTVKPMYYIHTGALLFSLLAGVMLNLWPIVRPLLP
jgi:hypothetical protein